MDVGLVSQLASDRTQANSLKACQGSFGLDIRKNLFMHWNRLPREFIESSPLEMFKRYVHVVFRDMWWWTWQYGVFSWSL